MTRDNRSYDEDSTSDNGDGGPNRLDSILTSIKGFMNAHKIGIALGVILLALVWILRPWFQGIYYFFWFEHIGVTFYLVLTSVMVGVLGAVGSKERKVLTVLLVLIVVILSLITLSAFWLEGAYVKSDVSEQTTMNTPEISNFSKAPAVDKQNLRIMTMKGANTQAQSSFNEPTHELSGGELVMRDGTLSTSYVMEPEGLYKAFTRQQKGAVFVTLNSTNPSVEQVNQKFKCGRGMLIFDSAAFQMQKDNMNTKMVNPTTFQATNGDLYNMWSGIQHSHIKFGMQYNIPMFYRTPAFTKVMLSDTGCNQEVLTPEEARNDPRMDGKDLQQFYPYELTRFEVVSTNLQNGLVNTFTDKVGMKALPDTKSIDNEPPYTMMFEDGTYKQVLTMEAIGGGTGVFEVYVVDGRTGEKTKYTYNTNLKGPGYAANAVIADDSEKFGPDKLTISEIYPVYRNGETWYQVNAVQSDTGIYGYTAFYNPGEGELLKAYKDGQIKAFYSGSSASHQEPENVIDVPNDNEGGSRSVSNPTLWVAIENENGETVYTVPVAGNESVNVDDSQPKNTTTTSS